MKKQTPTERLRKIQNTFKLWKLIKENHVCDGCLDNVIYVLREMENETT